jgi:SAM-dependent methyltransferase
VTLGAPRREFSEALAERNDRAYDDTRSMRGHRKRARVDTAVRLLGEGPGDVLDVGAGGGRLLAALHARGWAVSGIDPSPHMVALAHARVPGAAERVSVAHAEDLPFRDEAFDAVVVLAVLEYTDVHAALRECARVLRPGGRILIGLRSCPSPATVWRRVVVLPLVRPVKRLVGTGRPLEPDWPVGQRDVQTALETLGLEIECVEKFGATVVFDPFDRFAESLALRLARRAERSSRGRSAFGTQRIVVARKH